MGLLSPLDLLYGLSLAVLVIIYLHARSRSLEVSSLILFDDVADPLARPSVARVDLLFWLELLMLAALSLAVAGLFLKLAAAPRRIGRHALIFDLAAGMGAREGGQTRLELAKQRALAMVSSAAPGDQFSVLGYAQEAELRHASSADLGSVRRAIQSLTPVAVAARPAALTGAMLLARGSDSVELFADRLPAGATRPYEAYGNLHFHQIGAADDNLALVSLDPGTPGSAPGHCVIRNFATGPRSFELAIDCDGREVYHQASLTVAARGQRIVEFGPLASGGLLHARLLTPDALEADNQRWAYAPGLRDFHVLVVSPEAGVRDDLVRVLRAIDPNFVITATDPEHLRAAGDGHGAGLGHLELAVMHDYYDAQIRADARLLVYPRTAREPTAVKAAVPLCEMDERIGSGPLDHPLLLGPALRLELPAWMETLAVGTGAGRAGALALAAAGIDSRGRLGVLAFDIRNHLLLDPDRLDVLVLTVDLIKQLAAPQGLYITPTGAYVSISASGQARVLAPDGAAVTLRPDRWGRIQYRPLQEGRYRVESAGTSQLILANYYDAAESDLTAKPATLAAGRGRPEQVAATGLGPVWPLDFALIALAAALFASESVLLAGRALAGRQGYV